MLWHLIHSILVLKFWLLKSWPWYYENLFAIPEPHPRESNTSIVSGGSRSLPSTANAFRIGGTRPHRGRHSWPISRLITTFWQKWLPARCQLPFSRRLRWPWQRVYWDHLFTFCLQNQIPRKFLSASWKPWMRGT